MEQRDIPPYFEKIRQKAAQRWDQLEADAELASPWWQLFRQIQSPRHVLSELLQNADDAGAHSAEVRIEDDLFIFEHDGEDFTEEQFASLCRFGFSNKRQLRTIGFRGIGFKSIFSLGNAVELVTPSLAVRFSRHRFTEPVWASNAPLTLKTRISVCLRDVQVRREIQKSLDEWANSALSLLFFQSISRLTVGNNDVSRNVIGEGPVKGSERIRLSGDDELDVVHITSSPEAFPDDAVEEIRQERMTVDSDFSLPPCRVEIVIGVPGPQRLYVVLPTDKQTKMPFSVNATFVQDPARRGIKDPSISPTNRWLLERVGHLVTASMEDWLAREKCDLSKHAEVYQLLPDHADRSDDCDSYVCSIVSDYVEGSLFLLASDGSRAKRCFVPPYSFYEIWDPEKIAIFAGSGYDAVLCREIQPAYRDRLSHWGLITIHDNLKIVDWFETHAVPRPAGYDQIVQLWNYVLENQPYWKRRSWGPLNILPVEGSEMLHPAKQLVRIGDLIRGLSEDDMAFLSTYLQFFDRSFLRTATERLKSPDADDSRIVSEVLSKTNLDKESAAKALIERAYSQLASERDRNKFIRLAQIAGLLNTDVPNDFLYVTREGSYQTINHDLALDVHGKLEQILPQEYGRSHLLHEDYLTSLPPERRRTWIKWAESAKSGLDFFVGIVEQPQYIYGKNRLIEWLKAHGGEIPDQYPIQRTSFRVIDYGFDPKVLQFFERLCSDSQPAQSSSIWVQVFELIALDPHRIWKDRLQAKCYQRGNNNNHPLSCGVPRASWIRCLANTQCLPDTDGLCREPHELLLRNEKTESLISIEPFVRHDYDTEELQSLLLALGVRNTPGNPDSILDKIGIFAGCVNPPEYELIKLYERLDGLLRHCIPQEVQTVRRKFAETRMIYTQEGVWAFPHEVFRTIPGGKMAGIFCVLSALQDLPMWSRIGVMHEPTGDILIQQLKALEAGSNIESVDRNRVRTILSREPYRVWNEIGCWLSLDSIWKPVAEYMYYVSRNTEPGVDGLFPSVKGVTADMRMVDANNVCALTSVDGLENLQSALSRRITHYQECNGLRGVRPWMATLGRVLGRAKCDDSDEEKQMRRIAGRIAATVWTPVHKLEVTPYLDGTPAGREQKLDVFWSDQVLYVCDISPGRLLKIVPTELARVVALQSVKDAIIHCYDRAPEIIEEYCEANLTLVPENVISVDSPEPAWHMGENDTGEKPGVVHISRTEGADMNGSLPPKEDLPENTEPAQPKEDVVNAMESASPSSRKSRVERSRRRDLIDLLVEKQGYQWDSMIKRYIHPSGSWIQEGEAPFHWEMYASDGDVICRFWLCEGVLSRGIEMPVEVWKLMGRNPTQSAILLRAEDNGADVIPGTCLLEMEKGEEIEVFPAMYRLRRIGSNSHGDEGGLSKKMSLAD